MKVEFLHRFSKDLDKIREKRVKSQVIKLIEEAGKANNIQSLSGLKKLSGHKHAYRIRIGDYRIGLFIEKNVVQFARFVHRKEIYKVFP